MIGRREKIMSEVVSEGSNPTDRIGFRSKNRILLVDEDKTILESFRQILEMEGFEVDTAESGKHSLEKVCSGHFCLALVGGSLPDMSGGDVEEQMGAVAPHIRVLGLGTEMIDPKKLIEIAKANTESQI
jgi:DNA-binding NtrC family response regulator